MWKLVSWSVRSHLIEVVFHPLARAPRLASQLSAHIQKVSGYIGGSQPSPSLLGLSVGVVVGFPSHPLYKRKQTFRRSRKRAFGQFHPALACLTLRVCWLGCHSTHYKLVTCSRGSENGRGGRMLTPATHMRIHALGQAGVPRSEVSKAEALVKNLSRAPSTTVPRRNHGSSL